MPNRDSDCLLTLADLRASLKLRGLEFSESQLKRLRREGLLRFAGQLHRPGVRGSESLYPVSAVDQLELVARLEQEERRFAQLRVLVRWLGAGGQIARFAHRTARGDVGSGSAADRLYRRRE
jgi:hypothetical protein